MIKVLDCWCTSFWKHLDYLARCSNGEFWKVGILCTQNKVGSLRVPVSPVSDVELSDFCSQGT